MKNRDQYNLPFNTSYINHLNNVFIWNKDQCGNYYFSDSYYKMIGYDESEIAKFSEIKFAFIFEEDYQKVKEEVYQLYKKNLSSVSLEYRLTTKDNKLIWIKDNIYSEKDKSGNVVSLSGVAFIINDLKEKVNHSVKELEKHKNQNALKDKFFSIVSHDLRSPFTGILGFSEILLTDNSLSEPERREFTTYIFESAKTQLKLVNNLLDWARIESGRQLPDYNKISLKYAAYNAKSLLTEEAVKKSIEIDVDIEEYLYVLADEGMLSKAIFNLIENSIKFSFKGSVIKVTANQFNNEYNEIVIKDSGVGIAENIKSKIFKIDQKLSTNGTDGERGTGTGLILTRQLINIMGGEIWFYSGQDIGTEFHIKLKRLFNSVMTIELNEKYCKLIDDLFNQEYNHINIYHYDNVYEAISNIDKIMPLMIIRPDKLTLFNDEVLEGELKNKKHCNNIKQIIVSEEKNNIHKDEKNKYLIYKPVSKETLNKLIKEGLK